MDLSCLPGSKEEEARYRLHQNNVNDTGYRDFVSPIVNAIISNYSVNDKGLDFGSGQNSVIAHLLKKQGIIVDQYDPIFRNIPNLLSCKYNFIACCEVIEHFHNPSSEFKLLRSLLKPNGELFIMTDLVNENTDFPGWYYKNDFTHVFFYSTKAFHYIVKEFGFSDVTINNRLIVLKY